MENQHEHLMEIYFQEKEVSKRTEILNQLLLDMPVNAKDFFLKAFKKERYLDMKLSAVRGYAVYATEEEAQTAEIVLWDELTGVEGRMELLKTNQPFNVIIDYCQHYRNYEKVFENYRVYYGTSHPFGYGCRLC